VEAADVDGAATRAALVTIERVSAGDGERTEAVARFLRVRQGELGRAARLLGASVDGPQPGTCTVPESGSRAEVPAVQLLDVGNVSVTTAAHTSVLRVRRMPEVAELVSGVLYTRTGESGSFPPESRYVIRAEAGGEERIFAIAATAPRELEGVRVAGALLGREQVAVAAVSASGGGASWETVELAWEPGAPEDIVFADIESREHGKVAHCAFVDRGRGELPAWALDAAGAVAGVRLRRVHREAARAVQSWDEVEVRFEFTRTFQLLRAGSAPSSMP
jgi:hypothetical protein